MLPLTLLVGGLLALPIAIQAPAVNPSVNITAPALFAEVNGRVQIEGTAAGDDFAQPQLD
jgi:hypothetical protein